MRKASIIFVSLLLLVGLSGCGNNAYRPSNLDRDDNIPAPDESSAQEETAVEPPISDLELRLAALQRIFKNDTAEGTLEFFLFMLEHHEDFQQLSDEEIESLPRRFRHIVRIFGLHRLDTAEIEVADFSPFDISTIADNVDHNHPVYYYEIDVIVHDGGRAYLPLGANRWLIVIVDDNSLFIDFVMPYDEAINRLVARYVYTSEIQRTRLDAGFLRDEFGAIEFATTEEIPIETMVFYLLALGSEHDFLDEIWQFGRVMTQYQLDTNAQNLLGLEHVDGRATPYYLAERGFYLLPFFGGGLMHSAVLMVVIDQDKTFVYFDSQGYFSDGLRAWNAERFPDLRNERVIMRYTYIGDRLVSAVAVDYPVFASLILTGDDG